MANAFIDSISGGRAEFDRLKAGNPGWKPEVWATEHFKSMESQGKNPAWPGTSPDSGGTENINTSTPSFDIPTDKYPQSSSTSTTTSGIDWESSPAMQKIMSQLTEKIGSMDADIEKYSNIANDRYKALIREALGPQAFQGTMDDFAARNMMSSTFKDDAVKDVLTRLIRDVTDKSYQTQMNIAGQRIAIPERLGQLAGLGQRSETTSTTQQTNELAPYDLMAQIILNQ